MAAAVAAGARIAPDFAAAAAAAAGPAQRHFERHRGAGAGLMPRQRDFGAQAFDDGIGIRSKAWRMRSTLSLDRRKIDRDFVGKRAVELPLDRRASVRPRSTNLPRASDSSRDVTCRSVGAG